jgi:uncharacterized protein (TIGR04141 family)
MTDPINRHLRLLRFRHGVSVEQAVRLDRLREVRAAPSLGPGARLFVIDPDLRPASPAWMSFLQEAAAENLPEMRTTLNGAVVCVERRDRLWAFTFGTGHLFVNEDQADQRLGLRTVLNLVNAEQLRSVGSRVYEDVVVRTLRQVSRRSGRDTFTIDGTRDVLRDLTGAPADPSWGTEVTGGIAFTLSIPVEPGDLPALLDRVTDAHAQTTYQRNFAFVDFITPVSDPTLLDALDADVLEATSGAKESSIYLAPPEPILYEDVAGFCFFRERIADAHPELALQDYRNALSGPDEIALADLHSHTVRLMSASTGSERRSWSIYRCIVYETERQGRTYLLAEGEWFEIDPSFVSRVDRDLGRIGSPATRLPAVINGEDEPTYNERAAGIAGLALLDNRPVRIGGDSIEVADLLSASGELIHIKRKTSAPRLSHLFSQGRISATTLRAEPSARADAMAMLAAEGRPEAAVFADPFDMRTKTVVFAVADPQPPASPLDLSFFSRLNLWHAQRVLTDQLLYRVAFIGVPII